MADIRLISIIPPQAPIKGPAVPQGTSGSNSSPGLSSIENGTTLTGFIINRDSGGNPVLRTDSGDVTFASNFFLKIGSEVVIRVDNSSNQSLARILSVDGQSPEVAETTSSFAKQPEVLLTSQYRPPSALVSLNASVPANIASEPEAPNTITVFGTLIKPQIPTTTSATTPAPLPAGTQVALKVVSVEPPATSATPQATTPAATTPPIPASYAAYARAAGTPQTAPQTAPQATAQTGAQPAPTTTPTPATVVPAAPASTTTLTQPAAIPTPPTTIQTTPAAPTAPPTPSAPSTPALNPTTTVQQPAAPATVPQTQTITPPTSQNVTPQTTQPAATPTQIQPLPATTSQTTTPQTLPAAPVAPQATPIQTSTPTPSTTIQLTPPAAPTGTPGTTVQAPQIQTAAPAANFIGQTITSQVLGHETTGEALIQTPLGVVRLQPETALPTGSTITLRVLQTTPPALSSLNFNLAPGAPTSTQPAPLVTLAQQWSSLQQIFSLLSGRTPGAEVQTNLPVINTLAQAPNFSPKDIGSGIIFFISTLRSGSIRSWLGKDNVKWLEDNGQGNLIKKADGEMASIASQFNDTKPNQWQSLFFPVAVDGIPQQVRLFTKRDRKQGKDGQPETKSEDTRFVIELDLTQLGELQMDGFVRKQDSEVNFDLVIRTFTPLDTETQQDILAIYTATGAVTGYKGSLAFQSVKEFPVNPMKDIMASNNNVTA